MFSLQDANWRYERLSNWHTHLLPDLSPNFGFHRLFTTWLCQARSVSFESFRSSEYWTDVFSLVFCLRSSLKTVNLLRDLQAAATDSLATWTKPESRFSSRGADKSNKLRFSVCGFGQSLHLKARTAIWCFRFVTLFDVFTWKFEQQTDVFSL